MAVLIIGDLVFAFIKAYRILNEKKSFIGKKCGTKGSRQIKLTKEHSGLDRGST